MKKVLFRKSLSVSVFNEGGTNENCRAGYDLAQSPYAVKRHLGQCAGLL